MAIINIIVGNANCLIGKRSLSSFLEGSVRQAVELEKAGCQIIRAAIPNKDAVKLIPALKQAQTATLFACLHIV